MGSLTDIRTGLKNRLATITTIHALEKVPGVVGQLPTAFPMPGTIEFDETMNRGVDSYSFRVRLLVSRTTDNLAQEHLDPYLAGSGSSSVKAAIEGDGTLGGAADWTRVSRVTRYGDIDHNGISYLGADFDVEVSPDGA